MIKAKAKAIPPLPLQSLVANVLVCFLVGIGAPSPPVRENKHGP